MEKLLNEVKERIDFLDKLHDDQEIETKVFTVRVPVELLSQLDDIATVLQTTRTDVTKMILNHGASEIIEKFQIKVDKIGNTISFDDKLAFENANDDEKKAMIEKWQQGGEK